MTEDLTWSQYMERRLDNLDHRVTVLETYLKTGVAIMSWIGVVASGTLIYLIAHGF